MNWEAIAAMAEISGVLLVVASLAYVARQIGQNTAMMRVNAATQRLERDYELVLPVIESREFAEIWRQGDHDFDSIDPVDQQRLLFFERRAIVLWHHMHHLRIQGLLPESHWHEQLWIIQNLGRRQALRVAWDVFKDSFEATFQEFVEIQFRIGESNATTD